MPGVEAINISFSLPSVSLKVILGVKGLQTVIVEMINDGDKANMVCFTNG